MTLNLENLKSKIKSLEESELTDQDETKEDVYKYLLIYYLLEDEPMKAKFLWKRIPSNLKTSQYELTILWSLIQLLIQRKYSEAFDKANQLKASNYQYTSPELSNLVDNLIEKSKERLFDLINVAYSSINVKEMANMLKISVEETIKISTTQGWRLDETKSFLIPKKKQNQEIVGIPNQLQMEQLTKIVSFIET